jgi:hypothetical protein
MQDPLRDLWAQEQLRMLRQLLDALEKAGTKMALESPPRWDRDAMYMAGLLEGARTTVLSAAEWLVGPPPGWRPGR